MKRVYLTDAIETQIRERFADLKPQESDASLQRMADVVLSAQLGVPCPEQGIERMRASKIKNESELTRSGLLRRIARGRRVFYLRCQKCQRITRHTLPVGFGPEALPAVCDVFIDPKTPAQCAGLLLQVPGGKAVDQPEAEELPLIAGRRRNVDWSPHE